MRAASRRRSPGTARAYSRLPTICPTVRSTALAALRDAGLAAARPIAVHASEPLALVNALAVICRPSIPGRAPFPAAIHDSIAALICETARRA